MAKAKMKNKPKKKKMKGGSAVKSKQGLKNGAAASSSRVAKMKDRNLGLRSFSAGYRPSYIPKTYTKEQEEKVFSELFAKIEKAK